MVTEEVEAEEEMEQGVRDFGIIISFSFPFLAVSIRIGLGG